MIKNASHFIKNLEFVPSEIIKQYVVYAVKKKVIFFIGPFLKCDYPN